MHSKLLPTPVSKCLPDYISDPLSPAAIEYFFRQYYWAGSNSRQSHGSIYQEMEEVTTVLLSKVVEIAFPGESRRKKFQWLSQAEYLDGEGIVLVQLHDSLKPFLLELKKEFARIPLLEILRLRSRYAMAFYQMCCSWYGSSGRSWTLSVDELREWLRIHFLQTLLERGKRYGLAGRGASHKNVVITEF